MDKRFVTSALATFTLFFLISSNGLYAEISETGTEKQESRASQVLTNLTKSVADIQQRLHLIRGIVNATDFKETSTVEEIPTSTNVTYEELIDRVELARKKVQEMTAILKRSRAKAEEMEKSLFRAPA